MAVTATPVSARVRLVGDNDKTAATFYNVNPAVNADSIDMFSRAISAMRLTPIIGQYLIVDTELTESAE